MCWHPCADARPWRLRSWRRRDRGVVRFPPVTHHHVTSCRVSSGLVGAVNLQTSGNCRVARVRPPFRDRWFQIHSPRLAPESDKLPGPFGFLAPSARGFIASTWMHPRRTRPSRERATARLARANGALPNRLARVVSPRRMRRWAAVDDGESGRRDQRRRAGSRSARLRASASNERRLAFQMQTDSRRSRSRRRTSSGVSNEKSHEDRLS